jgi:ABC-type sugar transport system permease subunit
MMRRKRLSRIALLLFCLLIGLPSAAQAQEGDWSYDAGSTIQSAATSADGAATALGTRDSKVIYLNRDGEVQWEYDAGGTVLGVDVSRDGGRIFAVTEGRKALMLDATGQLLWEKPFDFVLIAGALSGDGDLAAVVPSKSRKVWVLDGEGNIAWEHEFDTPPLSVDISGDGQRVVFGLRDAWIRMFDRTGQVAWEHQIEGIVRDVALSADALFLAAGDESQNAYLLRTDKPGAPETQVFAYKAGGKVDGAAVSADGSSSAFGSRAGEILLLDQSGTVVGQHEAEKPVRAVTLSADGSLLVAGSDDGKAAGFGVKSSAASYAAGQSREQVLRIAIPVGILALIAAFVAFLRYVPAGQRVWEVQGAGPRRLGREIWRARLSYALLFPTVALLLIFNYYPAASGLFHGFTKWVPGVSTTWVGLANFKALIDNEFLQRGIINAVILIVTGYLKVLTMPLLVAELLFHLRSSRLQYWMRSLYIFPIVVPGVAIILVWRNIFDPNIGLINNTLALLGLMDMQQPQAWLGDPQTAIWSIVFIGFPWVSAFALLLYYGGLISIPTELFDAAKVDGASGFRRFWSLDLPLLMGQIKLLLILGFIAGMQEFSVVFLTTEGGPYNSTYTPALELYYQAMRFNNFGVASAIGTVLFLVILGGTIINMRYVRTSTEFQA